MKRISCYAMFKKPPRMTYTFNVPPINMPTAKGEDRLFVEKVGAGMGAISDPIQDPRGGEWIECYHRENRSEE